MEVKVNMVKEQLYPISNYEEALKHESAVRARITNNRAKGLAELIDLVEGLRVRVNQVRIMSQYDYALLSNLA